MGLALIKEIAEKDTSMVLPPKEKLESRKLHP